MRKITKMISKFNHHSGNNPLYIVIHDVGAVSTARNNGIYFGGGNRNASAHYFVDDTETIQVVEDYNGAWHVGDNKGVSDIYNTNSIGIEMCLPSGTVTAKTEANTVELVKYLMKKYNVPINRVVRHYDASRKNCPAQFNLDGKWTRWTAFKKKLTTTTVSAPKTETKPSTPTRKPLTDGKVGDTVKVVDALYADSTGSGRSTASRGKQGKIKRIVGNSKKYLIENWGWAHANDIELVKRKTVSKPKPTPAPKPQAREYAENGTFTITEDSIALRLGNTPNSKLIAWLNKGQSVKYDRVRMDVNGHVWVRQTPKRKEGHAWIATGKTNANAQRGNNPRWGTFK